uniref:PORR domain-containing protein n=1 Tax=Brassica campestris TaxID=3711 RepID=M4FBY3_BRACM
MKPNRVRFKSSTNADIILASKTHELYSLQDPSLSHYLQAVYNTYTTIFKLLTDEKRTLIDHLTHFRKEFALPNKLRALIVRHPELFYLYSLLSLHGCYKYNKGAAGDGVDSTEAIAIDSGVEYFSEEDDEEACGESVEYWSRKLSSSGMSNDRSKECVIESW